RARQQEPRVLIQHANRQSLDPRLHALNQLLAASAKESVHGGPVLGPALRVERLGEPSRLFQQQARAVVALADLDLAELLDEDGLEVRAEHLVIAVLAV